MSVAELLSASREAHRSALLLRQRRDPAHRDMLSQARDFRVQAVEADPAFVDPAWADERANHGALMAFYAKHLA